MAGNPLEWMRSSCGARFGFGGKMVSFAKPEPHPQFAGLTVCSVYLCQVGTELAVYDKASELYTALNGDGSSLNLPVIADLCSKRANRTNDPAEKCIWQCLEAHVQRQPRRRYGEIVGGSMDVNLLADKFKIVCDLSLNQSSESSEVVNGSCSTAADSSWASDQSQEVEDESYTPQPWPLPASADQTGILELPMDIHSKEGLLCQLITNSKYSSAVELCISENRWLDALQLSMLGDRRLYYRTQQRYFERLTDPVSKLITLVVNDRWDYLVAAGSLRNPDGWRQIFAILLSHVPAKELPERLEQLGKKMEMNNGCRAYAAICYIAAGMVDRVLECLLGHGKETFVSAQNLQDAMEKAIVLHISLGDGVLAGGIIGPTLKDSIGRYSVVLIEQGCLQLACQLMNVLPEETDKHLMELRHRLYNYLVSIESLPPNIRRPKAPYEVTQAYSHQQIGAGQRPRAGSAVPPPLPQTGQQYPTNVGGYPSQTYNQPAPTPVSASSYTSQHSQAAVPALKSTRNRYPSYSSDGISYPSASTVPPPASIANPAVNYSQYAGQPQQPQFQQYGNYTSGPPTFQQSVAPTLGVQQQQYSYQSATFGVGGSTNYSQAAPIAQIQLPPPPAGPAAQLHQRPWNDPPPMSPKKKTSQAKRAEVAPVTFPILGVGGVAATPDQGQFQYPHQPAMYSNTNPGTFAYPQAHSNPVQETAPPPAPAPAVVVPAEHEKIVNVLVRLAELSLAAAPNMQMKRRIEENLQKIKTNLPPLLAYGQLSQQTLSQLHQLMDYIRGYDYSSSLALLSTVVEGTDFSTISSFMPSVKAIIQCAAQMGVYYS